MARILVVDDEPGIRRVVRRVLRQAGHQVDDAETGEAAIPMLSAGEYEVALVDYNMPGMNGVEFLKLIREIQPFCARVIMSGFDTPAMIIDAINTGGVHAMLPKPFNDRSLFEVVEKALRDRRGPEADSRAPAMRQWRECVEGGLLYLDVQPIVAATHTHRVEAVECLLRSRHPILSRPDKILTAVETAGTVLELGSEVNRLAAAWAERLSPDILVFVNLHPLQLGDPHLLDRFAPLVPHADRIVLEITERADLHQNSGWESAIERLTTAGFHFALDDLGAGYNSLALLAELQPRFIKIDMSITRDIHLKPRKQRLVELVARFAAGTERVVGEGVETEAEAQTLTRCGVSLLQGYLFGRPASRWPPAAPEGAGDA